jgi:hypothetical protein
LAGTTGSKNRQIDGVDNFSWEVHGHQLKFGADDRYLAPSIDKAAYSTSLFYPNIPAVYSDAFQFALVEYSQPYTLEVKSFSSYAQDSWKVTPRLVLTYGTRWEYDPAPRGKDGKSPITVTSLNLNTTNFSYLTLAPLGTPIYHAAFTNFAPRLGFSYVVRPHGGSNTVLRGGSGIFYDTGQGGVGSISFPYTQDLFVLPGTGLPGYPVFTLPVPANYAQAPPTSNTPTPTSPATLAITVPNYKMPRVYQWNLTLQQDLGRTSVFSLAYVGSSAHDLQHSESFIFNEVPQFVSPDFSELTVITNAGASNYNSLQAQVQSHVARVLEMQASYTWSHAIDNGTSNLEFNSNDPRLDRASSDYDVRNSVSAAATYNLPFYRGGSIAKALLSGWAVNSIFGAHSSPPFAINARTFTVGTTGVNYTERANRVPGEPVWIDANSVGGFTVPGGRYVNPAAFVNPPATETQGDVGRNSLRGFDYWQLDFGVHRMFPITKRVHMQFPGLLMMLCEQTISAWFLSSIVHIAKQPAHLLRRHA